MWFCVCGVAWHLICVRVCGLDQLTTPVSFHAPPVFCFFSTHLFPFSPPPSQLYHVIRMNLHRDSPIWRRQGFRKCLKMTQQQQAEFPCLWELHWDKLDFKCGSGLLSLTGGLTLNPDATTQILIPPTLHFWTKILFTYFIHFDFYLFFWLFYAFILFSAVMVQTDSSLLFFILKYNTHLCFLQFNVF